MTEEEKIEQMCYARIDAVVNNLNQICFGQNAQPVNGAGQEVVKLIIATEFLPVMLRLGTRPNVPAVPAANQPKTDHLAETLDFVRTVLSVPEEMIPARVREQAEHLLPELSQ
jgi:hypothetical protein